MYAHVNTIDSHEYSGRSDSRFVLKKKKGFCDNVFGVRVRKSLGKNLDVAFISGRRDKTERDFSGKFVFLK